MNSWGPAQACACGHVLVPDSPTASGRDTVPPFMLRDAINTFRVFHDVNLFPFPFPFPFRFFADSVCVWMPLGGEDVSVGVFLIGSANELARGGVRRAARSVSSARCVEKLLGEEELACMQSHCYPMTPRRDGSNANGHGPASAYETDGGPGSVIIDLEMEGGVPWDLVRHRRGEGRCAPRKRLPLAVVLGGDPVRPERRVLLWRSIKKKLGK